jgi:penicillin-binding protein 1A
MALGTGETTLLRLTTAYSMVVNGGKRITSTFVDRIHFPRRSATVRRLHRCCVAAPAASGDHGCPGSGG